MNFTMTAHIPKFYPADKTITITIAGNSYPCNVVSEKQSDGTYVATLTCNSDFNQLKSAPYGLKDHLLQGHIVYSGSYCSATTFSIAGNLTMRTGDYTCSDATVTASYQCSAKYYGGASSSNGDQIVLSGTISGKGTWSMSPYYQEVKTTSTTVYSGGLVGKVSAGREKVATQTRSCSVGGGIGIDIGVSVWVSDIHESTCMIDGYTTWTCRVCGYSYNDDYISATGHKYTSKVVKPTCTAQGYTKYTCSTCGDNYKSKYISATGHTYSSGICTSCGAEDPDYAAPVECFNLAGESMTLGNGLSMNFFVNVDDLSGDDYYAEITKSYADGRADDVEKVDFENWTRYSDSLYCFSYNGVAAKEMADDISVTIYNIDGTQASNAYTTSIRNYAMRMLNNDSQSKIHTLMADMLNYGAAAQQFFKYNTGDLANSQMTDSHKGCATKDFSMSDFTDSTVKDTGYAGLSLVLEDNIVLNMYFDSAIVDKTMTAKVSYTNHYGREVSYEISGDKFVPYGNAYYTVQVDTLVVADSASLVAIDIYDGEERVAGGIANIESYAVRTHESVPVVVDMLKFCESAYHYFHG